MTFSETTCQPGIYTDLQYMAPVYVRVVCVVSVVCVLVEWPEVKVDGQLGTSPYPVVHSPDKQRSHTRHTHTTLALTQTVSEKGVEVCVVVY